MIADDSGSTDATDFTTWNTGTLPLDVPTFEENDLMDWFTYDRQFVSDLPWYRRFIIWLFPRMFDLEDYP